MINLAAAARLLVVAVAGTWVVAHGTDDRGDASAPDAAAATPCVDIPPCASPGSD